jgi:hypothetical protein
MANVLPAIEAYVGESLKSIKVEEYTRDVIIVRYILIFNWKITLLAKDYPQMFPNGFPVTPDGKIPSKTVFTFRILGKKIILTIPFIQYKAFLRKVVKL